MTNTVLVTGGAGYIGSHAVKLLRDRGDSVVVIDNLSYGHKDALPMDVPFYEGDIADAPLLATIFKTHRIDAVMHFAAFTYVGESMTEPLKYYRNNFAAPLTLIQATLDSGCRKFIFSSTCATYGEPDYVPIDELHPQRPINPYGKSKLMLETALTDCGRAFGLQSVFLRYFNVAGADPNGCIGEEHNPETHLIPLVIDAALGKRESVSVFGTDYDTPDGTCIRDYVHVVDLCDAHLLALDYLNASKPSAAFNLGTGAGFSVREIINAVKAVSGKPVRVIETARRPGDPPKLIANSKKAKDILGWSPKYDDVRVTVETAWNYHRQRRG
ncbi:MAG: UDP-glucose 4-epimerase GalE [Planctomycetota bacterium]